MHFRFLAPNLSGIQLSWPDHPSPKRNSHVIHKCLTFWNLFSLPYLDLIFWNLFSFTYLDLIAVYGVFVIELGPCIDLGPKSK